MSLSCLSRLTLFIVTATEIFFGRKERNARSLNRNYLGDYCNLYERADLHKLIPRHERVDFSSYIYKYDRRFRRQGRYLIITNQALYIIEQDHVESSASFCPPSIAALFIDLDQITQWTTSCQSHRSTQQSPRKLHFDIHAETTYSFRKSARNQTEVSERRTRSRQEAHAFLSCASEYRDNFFLICVRDDYGTLLELSSKTEAIAVMTKNFSKKTQRTLPVIFTQG